MTEVRLCPSTAAMEMASSRPGIDSRMSTTRMISESTQPPKAPASRPSSIPPAKPMDVATTPTSSDWREP